MRWEDERSAILLNEGICEAVEGCCERLAITVWPLGIHVIVLYELVAVGPPEVKFCIVLVVGVAEAA